MNSLFGNIPEVSKSQTTGDPLACVSSAPLARTSDPDTSHKAASGMARSGRRHGDCITILRALDRMERRGESRTTPTMIAREAGWGMDNVRVCRRSGDLRGLIETGQNIQCPLKGSTMRPWRLSNESRDWLNSNTETEAA